MPAMTIPELKKFIAEHFLQAPADVEIEHLDDTKIRVRQKTHDRNLRPGGTVAGPTVMAMVDFGFYLLLLGRLGPVAHAVTTNLNINFMRKPEPVDLLGEGRLLKLGKDPGGRRFHRLERREKRARGARDRHLLDPA